MVTGKKARRQRMPRAVALLGAVALGLGTLGCGPGDDSARDDAAEETAEGGTTGPAEDTGSQGPEEEAEAEAGGPGEEGEPSGEPPGPADPGEGAGNEPGEVTPTGAPKPSLSARPAEPDAPHVLNFYGEENTEGSAERSPRTLVLSEFTTISDLTWERWDTKRAVGTGAVSGTWCLPECLDDPLPASVVLSDPESVRGKVFYTAFLLEPEKEADAAQYEGVEDLNARRPLATP
ncbi:hypothetical protein PJ985_10670 [Streptomyces sp. ACA25]|uniref:hypothetical protein n=1 Tax=Streptomyces sp. ACA25 TaxID=3022596 RepID=UPI0023082C7E|nr:hypothetical protein [Streptomyces sp. ACA25]MDB1088027.1 hypothetical protein [Streptomyces sp. ACA25]